MIAEGWKDNVKVLTIEKPVITQSDADAYAGSIGELRIQGGGGGTLYPAAPQVDPVAELQSSLSDREKIAAENITRLKARTAAKMLAGGMSESATMAAGSQLVLDNAAKIQAYILAGGNPVAGQALIDEIVAAPPAWWSPQMLALFESELL